MNAVFYGVGTRHPIHMGLSEGPLCSEGGRPGGPNVKKSMTKLEIKQPFQARAGIDSLQFALPLMWTVGRQFGVTLDELHKLMSEGIT